MRHKRPTRERWHHWRGIYRRAFARLGFIPIGCIPEYTNVQIGGLTRIAEPIASKLIPRAYVRMGRLYRKRHRR